MVLLYTHVFNVAGLQELSRVSNAFPHTQRMTHPVFKARASYHIIDPSYPETHLVSSHWENPSSLRQPLRNVPMRVEK